MIVTFCLQEDTGEVSSVERARYTIGSVRKNIPGAKIVQLSNDTFPGIEGVDEVLRHPYRGDFIMWGFGAMIKLCERPENILQIATDVLVCKNVRDVFNDDFHVAACRYPAKDRNDNAFCGDVDFIKPGGGEIFNQALAVYQSFRVKDGWEGGQTAFLRATIDTSLTIKELDYDTYCRTPDKQQDNLDEAALIHFRGPRKLWMIDYAKTKGY